MHPAAADNYNILSVGIHGEPARPNSIGQLNERWLCENSRAQNHNPAVATSQTKCLQRVATTNHRFAFALGHRHRVCTLGKWR